MTQPNLKLVYNSEERSGGTKTDMHLNHRTWPPINAQNPTHTLAGLLYASALLVKPDAAEVPIWQEKSSTAANNCLDAAERVINGCLLAD